MRFWDLREVARAPCLNIISGLLSQDEGTVYISGKSSTSYLGWGKIVYMFQEDRLLPWRTVRDNVAFGLENSQIPKSEWPAKIGDVLKLVNLEDFADFWPHQLSGGMRSRVALARSLVAEPQILLMDEPFSKLDAQTRSQLHAELLKIHQLTEMTIVFVTHDVEEAVVLAESCRCFFIQAGTYQGNGGYQNGAAQAVNGYGGCQDGSGSEEENMKFLSVLFQRIVLAGLFLFGWYLVSTRVPAFVLPGPNAVLEAFLSTFIQPDILEGCIGYGQTGGFRVCSGGCCRFGAWGYIRFKQGAGNLFRSGHFRIEFGFFRNLGDLRHYLVRYFGCEYDYCRVYGFHANYFYQCLGRNQISRSAVY